MFQILFTIFVNIFDLTDTDLFKSVSFLLEKNNTTGNNVIGIIYIEIISPVVSSCKYYR